MATLQTPVIEYPDSDGKPMADNTIQYQWMVKIKGNLDVVFADRDDVFVAGNLFWYPVKGQPKIVRAPDILVAMGRPKGDRGSYKQWEENGVAPQVVMEILSHCNVPGDVDDMLEWYERYGVEEFYVYDSETKTTQGWQRQDGELVPIEQIDGWVSPRLGVRFEINSDLKLFRPDGQLFLSEVELDARWKAARQRADQARRRANREERRAEREQKRAEQEQKRAEQEQKRAEREQKRAEQEQKRAEQEQKRADEEKRRADEAAAQNQRMREFLRRQGFDPDQLPG